MSKPKFQVIRKGTGWTQFGPTPDTILSSHTTLSAAQKAFDKVLGAAILKDPSGATVNHRIV
jgi:hypothetical protein